LTIMRIASLLSSATEIVGALGLADQLVGVTFECDHPLGIRERTPVLVQGLPTDGLTPAEIDELVRKTAEAGLPMYRLDEVGFARANPDLVLTQDLCRVCALPSDDVEAALAHLKCSAAVVSLDPHCLVDVLDSIATIAHAAGVPEVGERVLAELRARLATVRHAVAGKRLPRVFLLEWSEPPFLAGHWIPDLIEAAGGEPVLARGGERSVPTTFEAIGEADPDIIVIAPCGFGLDDAVQQAHDVLDRLPMKAAVWALDSNGCVVRPGPRLIDGVEQLAAIFHDVAAVDPSIARRLRA
jgi:iron complex transport system substrate-binding protein